MGKQTPKPHLAVKLRITSNLERSYIRMTSSLHEARVILFIKERVHKIQKSLFFETQVEMFGKLKYFENFNNANGKLSYSFKI